MLYILNLLRFNSISYFKIEEYLLNDSHLTAEKIVFCNKVGCEGHSNLFLIKKKFPKEEFIYNVDRKVLDESLCCQIKENKDSCGFCKSCEVCMQLLEFRLELNNCYYYKLRTDAPF